MSRILVDTSAYSEHLRDHPEVKAAIQRASAIGLSVVSIGVSAIRDVASYDSWRLSASLWRV